MYQIQKFLWCYDAIIDEMLARPESTKAEIGARLHYTPQAMYIITNSDSFNRRWEERRGDFSKGLEDSLLGKLRAQAEAATDAIIDRIEKEKHDMAPQVLLETQEGALKALGYGSKNNTGVSVQVNMPLVSSDIIHQARERSRSLEPSTAVGQLT